MGTEPPDPTEDGRTDARSTEEMVNNPITGEVELVSTENT